MSRDDVILGTILMALGSVPSTVTEIAPLTGSMVQLRVMMTSAGWPMTSSLRQRVPHLWNGDVLCDLNCPSSNGDSEVEEKRMLSNLFPSLPFLFPSLIFPSFPSFLPSVFSSTPSCSVPLPLSPHLSFPLPFPFPSSFPIFTSFRFRVPPSVSSLFPSRPSVSSLFSSFLLLFTLTRRRFRVPQANAPRLELTAYAFGLRNIG